MEYYTHDNGGRPFKVILYNTKLEVYKYTSTDSYGKKIYNHKVMDIDDYENVFIGVDRRYPDFEGQSILIKKNKYNYIHICTDIYEFITEDEIDEYVSELGNSDVVYDFAIGSQYIYLLAEKKKFLVDDFNPYSLYYQHKPKTENLVYKVIQKRL